MTPSEARARLRVECATSKAKVQEAFRRAIRKNHPDRGGHTEEAKLDIEAREVLLRHEPNLMELWLEMSNAWVTFYISWWGYPCH